MLSSMDRSAYDGWISPEGQDPGPELRPVGEADQPRVLLFNGVVLPGCSVVVVVPIGGPGGVGCDEGRCITIVNSRGEDALNPGLMSRTKRP
jgi:hypothetical protein